MTVPLDAISAPAHDPRPLGNDARPARAPGVGRDGTPAVTHPRLVSASGMDAAEGTGRPVHACVLLAATAVMSLGVVVPVPSVRALLVVPVALLAPGYALLMALFGDARRTGLDLALLLALSVLLSLACYPLLALLLHLAALPMTTGTVVGAIDSTIMLLLAGASWRSAQHSSAMLAPRVGAPPDVATGSAWEGLRGGLRFALVVVAAGLILAATLRLLPAPAGAPYTMFYLAGRSAYLADPVGARGYRSVGLGPWERCVARARAAHRAARTTTTGAVGTVDLSIGVTNGSAWRRSYRVTPLLDSVPCWPSQALSLGPGASWSGHVSGVVPADGALHRLTITLRQPGQLGGGRQDGASSMGPLVVWVRGARPPRVTHRGTRQSPRPRQTGHGRHGPRPAGACIPRGSPSPCQTDHRRHRPRRIPYHPGSTSRPPTWHSSTIGSASVRRAWLYAIARPPARQGHVIGSAGGPPARQGHVTGSAGGPPARQGLVTGSAGGPPVRQGLLDAWGHRSVRWRRKWAGRPRSRLSMCTTSCGAATLRRKRPGGSYSQPDHASTPMHQPRLRGRPSPRRLEG